MKVAGAEMRSVERMTDAPRSAPQGDSRRGRARCRPAPRRLRVALDACNGAGSLVAPRLLEALGVDVVPINVTPNGLFPRAGRTAAREPRRAVRGRARASAATSASRRTWTRTASPSCPSAASRSARTSRWCWPPGTCSAGRRGRWWPTSRRRRPSTRWRGASAARSCARRSARPTSPNACRRERAVIGGEGNGGVIYPSHQLRARQPGGHGAHPPPARLVRQDGVGPGGRTAARS